MATRAKWYSIYQEWCSTNSGRKVLGSLAGVFCVSGTCAYLLPQGMFLNTWVQQFQLHKDGSPAPLKESLQKKGEEVLEKTDLTPRAKKLIQFFSMSGFDVYHLGSTATKHGAAVGIPKTFAYKKVRDVDPDIVIHNCPDVPWSSEEGRNLLKSLVLSDNAQKFAIAREIYASSYPMLHIRGFSASSVLLFVVVLSKWGNKKFNLLQAPIKTRSLWYTVASALGFGIWISVKDISTVFLDGASDRLASSLGPEYVDGGVEYYEKKMLMNRSLRVLMGDRGKSFFTVHGNYYSLIRNKTMPPSQRLDILKQLQKERQEEQL